MNQNSVSAVDPPIRPDLDGGAYSAPQIAYLDSGRTGKEKRKEDRKGKGWKEEGTKKRKEKEGERPKRKERGKGRVRRQRRRQRRAFDPHFFVYN